MKLMCCVLGAACCFAAPSLAGAADPQPLDAGGVPDTTLPEVQVVYPGQGAAIHAAQPVLRGDARDEQGLEAVYVTLSTAGSALLSDAPASLDAAEGTWWLDLGAAGVDISLVDGVGYALRVVAVDGAGNQATAVRFFNADTSVPPAHIVRPVQDAQLASRTPTVSGTAEPGCDVRVRVGALSYGPVLVGDDGRFSVVVADALADGSYTLEVISQRGPLRSEARVDVVVDADVVLEVDAPDDGATLALGAPLEVSGTARPGARLSLLVDGRLVANASASADGAWELLPSAPLATGSHVLRIVAGDGQGNVVTVSLEVRIDAPSAEPDPSDEPTAIDAGGDGGAPGDGGQLDAAADAGEARGPAAGEGGAPRDGGPASDAVGPGGSPAFKRAGGAGCSVGLGGAQQGLFAVALLLLWMARRSMRVLRLAVPTLLTAVAAASGRAAADDGFALDRYRATQTLEDGFAVSRPDDMGHRRYGLQLQLDYMRDPLVLEEPTADGSYRESASIVENQLTAQLAFHYGLAHRVVLFGGLPVILVQDGDAPGVAGVPGADGAGLGDLWTGARVRLWGAREAPFALALQGMISVPLAQALDGDRAYSGAASVTGMPELLLEGRLRTARITANLGAELGKGAARGEEGGGQRLLFGLGLTVRVAGALDLLLESYGSTLTSAPIGAEETPFELLAGARYFRPSGWMAGVSVGPGLGRGVGAPEVRAIAMVGYGTASASPSPAPPPPPAPSPSRDADGDSVDDARDRCPGEREDLDGFRDLDGCPDADNDRDGILDVDDRCPDVPEDHDGFGDRDGCPDLDNDHDGVFDVDDDCPSTPRAPTSSGCASAARVEGDSIRLDAPLEITDRQSGVVIQPGSVYLLMALRDLLEDNAHVHKLRIDVHTDDRGQDLRERSQRQAVAIKQWLVEHGIDPARLGSSGCGEALPIAFNDTAEGRAANRRVELTVVDLDTEGFAGDSACTPVE